MSPHATAVKLNNRCGIQGVCTARGDRACRAFVALKGGDEWIDFDTLERMATAIVDKGFRNRFNDMVWRIRLRYPKHDTVWM